MKRHELNGRVTRRGASLRTGGVSRGLALALVVGLTLSAVGLARAADPRPAIRSALSRVIVAGPVYTPSVPTRIEEFTDIPELRPVSFDFDRSTIRPRDLAVIDASAEWLRDHPTHDIVIEGYADERGTQGYNLALAQRRAQAVKNELVRRGVDERRISLASYGVGRPACRTPGEICWSPSRRVELLIREIQSQAS